MTYILIAAAHYQRSPYVEDYVSHFERKGIKFKVIYWDRTHLDNSDTEKSNYIRYSNKKNSLAANFIDYLKYCFFVCRELKSNEIKDAKLVIFTVQLQFIIFPLLRIYRISNVYINDVRDYHKLSQNSLYQMIFRKSEMNVISSDGFREWLPDYKNIILKHNLSLFDNDDYTKYSKKTIKENLMKRKLEIGHVGSLSHYSINEKVNIINDNEYIFSYYGDGLEINKYYALSEKNPNVRVHGRYDRNDEVRIYQEFDITNLLFDNSKINARTLMPNRLYSSLLYRTPSVVFSGSHLAKQVADFGLGIVISDVDQFTKEFPVKLTDFLENIDYESNAQLYLNKIRDDNKIFYDYLE